MSDLLVRNLPDQLRTEIRKAASKSGRSLSEEAKHLIRRGLSTAVEIPEQGHTAWDELRDALGTVQLSEREHDDLLDAVKTARGSAIRQTPEFE